jgi:hypothetical protein
MLTNNNIERELQNNKLWFHRNNYFEAKIRDLPEDPSGVRCTEKKFVINATENDILFIPVNAITNSSLDAESKTSICSGDITKVEVRQEYTKYVLVCTKDTGDIFKIYVDAYADKVQLEHIIAFVETFKNTNIELLYALKRDDVREAMKNIRNKTTSTSSETAVNDATEQIGKVWNKISNAQNAQNAIGPIILIVFFFFFFIPIFSTIMTVFGEVADNTFPILAVVPVVFLVFFVFVFITIFKNAVKNRDNIMQEGPGRVTYDYKQNNNNNEQKTNRGPMTQEKMENIREKIDEEMVTSSGPINSNDSDYGGIKKY